MHFHVCVIKSLNRTLLQRILSFYRKLNNPFLLNFTSNLINSFSGDWFSLPNSLRKLILSGNSIDYLPQRLLNKFQRLAWLDLSSNFISNLTHESLPPNVQVKLKVFNYFVSFLLACLKIHFIKSILRFSLVKF